MIEILEKIFLYQASASTILRSLLAQIWGPLGDVMCVLPQVPIKAALADWKKVVKTGSIFMGRGRVIGRGSAESRLKGMGRGSVGA